MTAGAILLCFTRAGKTTLPRLFPGDIEAAFVLFILGNYFGWIHLGTKGDLAHAGKLAFDNSQTVEDFRTKERQWIKRTWNPHHRYYARRYLDRECEALSLRYYNIRKGYGRPEEPV